jgi:hypothetical protein
VVGEKKNNLMPNAANNKNIGCGCFYCHITAELHHVFKVFETDNLTIHIGDPRIARSCQHIPKK